MSLQIKNIVLIAISKETKHSFGFCDNVDTVLIAMLKYIKNTVLVSVTT